MSPAKTGLGRVMPYLSAGLFGNCSCTLFLWIGRARSKDLSKRSTSRLRSSEHWNSPIEFTNRIHQYGFQTLNTRAPWCSGTMGLQLRSGTMGLHLHQVTLGPKFLINRFTLGTQLTIAIITSQRGTPNKRGITNTTNEYNKCKRGTPNTTNKYNKWTQKHTIDFQQ